MPHWEVRIIGEVSRLQLLAQVSSGGAWAVRQRKNEFFLAGDVLDALAESDAVRDKAAEIVASLSGASNLFLSGSSTIQVDYVVRVGDGGRQEVTIFPEPVRAETHLHVSATVTRADGSVEESHATDPVLDALRKAERDEPLQRVLRLRAVPALEWTGLYRIFEAVQDDGGAAKADHPEVGLFKQTANSRTAAGDLARHGNEKTDPPQNPMALADARILIDQIIKEWIASK